MHGFMTLDILVPKPCNALRLVAGFRNFINCQFSSATRCNFTQNNSPPTLQQLTQLVLYTDWPRNEDMNEIRERVRVMKNQKQNSARNYAKIRIVFIIILQ